MVFLVPLALLLGLIVGVMVIDWRAGPTREARGMEGTAAGLAVLLALPIGAVGVGLVAAAVAGVLGLVGGEPLPAPLVIAASMLGAALAACRIGAVVAPPWRRGVARAFGVLVFAAVAGVGTGLSPLLDEDWAPLAGLLAAASGAALSGAALLAPGPEGERAEQAPPALDVSAPARGGTASTGASAERPAADDA